ncbi:MAG: hypothetical protein A2Z16_14915 [Chloroflexi bacterium RBG_16_54_18]|nr:MAG: hypothetical protein A2Z16_14915 [Chloroflexi bacterium RBG_16_54_18]
MSVEDLLTAWQLEPTVGGNFTDWHTLPARIPQYSPLPDAIHPVLAAVLRQKGITSLFTHQTSAWESVQAGKNVVVVTGTASGKTLCYNLPVLDRLLRETQSTALYLFPTKALAQDQLALLKEWVDGLYSLQEVEGFTGLELEQEQIPIAIYDGDTPSQQRQAIRSRSRLLITNPDMLHIGILPHHTRWIKFFSSLRYVVIDEIHTYRGVFGSHVANVIRRLKRIGRFYGARPQFILTSATIENPAEFSARLAEEEFKIITEDGSRRGAKYFLIYNPPVIDRELGLRRSALQESVRLAEDLLAYNLQSIIFARSRRTVEIILTYLRQRSITINRGLKGGEFPPTEKTTEPVIRGYRSGYLPQERRAIERGLRLGQVRVVVATNALELGIDIGDLQAALLVGYPGTIAATWQQSGRAGRGESASLAVLVATADPLDQFLASHPNYLFERTPEHALINPDNPLILLHHLRCASFELPFIEGEGFEGLNPDTTSEYLEVLQEQRQLHHSGSKYFWMAEQYPAQGISLRSAASQPVLLQALDAFGEFRTIGQVDRSSAVWLTHPQAVYLHEGQTYLVDDLDLDLGTAHLSAAEVDYYTLPRSQTSVQLFQQISYQKITGGSKAFGELLVTTRVNGYRKIRWHTHETLGFGELDLPPTELLTTGYWLAMNEASVENLRSLGLWRGDTNEYGPGWDRLRQLVRQRDGYLCQVCGTHEIGRAHDVHHKIPFRTFTSAEQANRLENLTTLCPTCHQRVESAVRVRSGLSGTGYVLHHLAPFFLMCDTADLGVHTDLALTLISEQDAQAQTEIPSNGIPEESSRNTVYVDNRPGIVLYDFIPAGIGFSQRLFEIHGELLSRALELVQACPCTDGCPSCVGPGGEQGLGGKEETLAILSSFTA